MTDADLTRLVHEHRARTEVLLSRRYGRHVAEDAVAEALVILVRVHGRIDFDGAAGYFITVARHEAIRLARRAEHVPLDDVAHYVAHDFAVDMVVPDRIETRERLRLLAALTPDQRTALVEQALGYSYHEIGARHSWTYTKVNRCVTEGRARLRRLATPVPTPTEEVRSMATTEAEAPKRRRGRPRKPTVSPQEAASMITSELLIEQVETELGRVTREVEIQQGTVTAAQTKLDALTDRQSRLSAALAAVKDAVEVLR